MAGAGERKRTFALALFPTPTPTAFVSSPWRPQRVLTSWTWSKVKGATIGKGPEWEGNGIRKGPARGRPALTVGSAVVIRKAKTLCALRPSAKSDYFRSSQLHVDAFVASFWVTAYSPLGIAERAGLQKRSSNSFWLLEEKNGGGRESIKAVASITGSSKGQDSSVSLLLHTTIPNTL